MAIDRELMESLREQEISLVCLAQYSCYIHLDNHSHIRIESSLRVRLPEGNIVSIFPAMDFSQITSLFGRKVIFLDVRQNAVQIELEGGFCLIAALVPGYESVHIVVKDREVLTI